MSNLRRWAIAATAVAGLLAVSSAHALPLVNNAAPLAQIQQTNPMLQQAHGFHCRWLWGPTRRGWRWHRNIRACWDHDFDSGLEFHLHLGPHVRFGLHQHRDMF